MFGIEEIVVGDIDEELAAVGVGTGIRHRYRTGIVLIIRADLICKCIARTSLPPPFGMRVVFTKGIAALEHETQMAR